MLDTTHPAHLTTRLRALLDLRASGLDEAAIEEVRSARPELSAVGRSSEAPITTPCPPF